MIEINKNLLKFSLILLSFLIGIKCRQLSAELNPGCDINIDCQQYSKKHSLNLVDIQSKGDKETVHYLWSSITCIPPTLLIVETDVNSKLEIKWDQLLKDLDKCSETTVKKAIIVTNGSVTNSIGFQFSRLYFFNFNNKTDRNLEVNWKTMVWEQMSSVPKSGDSIKLSFKNSEKSTIDLYNGSLAFNLRVDGSDGRNDDLPHLAFTQKSVSLEMSLNNVQAQKFYDTDPKSKPRIKAEINVMSGEVTHKSIPEFDSITSIDDEYTPGVFRRIVLDVKSGDKQQNSFMSWKPISYNKEERIIANTLDVIHGKVESVNTSQLIQYNSRIFEAFFDIDKNPKYEIDLTFGAEDDETYYSDDKTYNTFSMVVGVDSAPDEELSLLVKIILVVGFGLPLLVMIVSALYLIVRKIRKRKLDGLSLNQSQQNLGESQE